MPSMPFLEYLARMVQMAWSSENDLEFRLLPMRKYGHIYKLRKSVVISNPEFLKQVISENWPKISMGGLQNSILFKYLMGEGLVGVGGE